MTGIAYIHMYTRPLPMQTKLRGYIGITLSIRLFTSCSDHIFLLPCPIWIIFHTIVVHDPRSRSQFTHGKNVSIPLTFKGKLDGDDVDECCPSPRGCWGCICPNKTGLLNNILSRYLFTFPRSSLPCWI